MSRRRSRRPSLFPALGGAVMVALVVLGVLVATDLVVLRTRSSADRLRSSGDGSATTTANSPQSPQSVTSLVVAGGGAPVAPVRGCVGRPLVPERNLQQQVAEQPSGTAFCFAAARYDEAAIVPRAGDRFEGTPQTVLSGSRRLMQWTREGNAWAAGTDVPERGPHGVCRPDLMLCSEPARLFLDDNLLAPVGSAAALRPGSYFLDRPNRRVYLGEDPTNRRAEITLVAHAFASGEPDVTILGLTVQRYSSSAQEGAIQAFDGASGWRVERVTVREASGAGIGARNHDRFVLRDSVIERSGQLGVGVSGRDILIEHNRIAGNNTAGFAETWEAGGGKFTSTRDLVLRGNLAVRNGGPGLWTDIDNVDATVERNVTDDNLDSGIFHEVSYAAVIRDNVARGNGFGIGDRWCYGAGILVSASSGATVTGNTVIDNHRGIIGVQQARGGGPFGTYLLDNMKVTGNRIVANRPDGLTGVCDDTTGAVYGAARGNVFASNSYEGPGVLFQWAGSPTADFAAWQATGQDRDGVRRAIPDEPLDAKAAQIVAEAGPRP